MYEDFFSERLAQLRTQKDVTARDMSLRLGVGAGYINNIENKRNLPSMLMFFCICDFLKITPAQFFESNVKNPGQLNDLVCKLETLTGEQLAALTAVADEFAKIK